MRGAWTNACETQPASCKAATPLPTRMTASTAIRIELIEKNRPIGRRLLTRNIQYATAARTTLPAARPARIAPDACSLHIAM